MVLMMLQPPIAGTRGAMGHLEPAQASLPAFACAVEAKHQLLENRVIDKGQPDIISKPDRGVYDEINLVQAASTC